MLPTVRGLLRLSEKTGFRIDTLEKVIRLAELLLDIDQHPVLGDSLVLKGGTALNLSLGPPRRLSVDLDFNFIGSADREGMLKTRPRIEQSIEAIARDQGYGVQRSAESHAGRKHFLSYQRLGDGLPDRLEVDINYLHRVSLLPAERRPIWRPDNETSPEPRLLSWPEIASGKLIALLDRAAPRDAWDVARLPELSRENWPPPLLRPVFIALAGTLPRPLPEYDETRLGRIRDEDVTRLLHPMLLPGDQSAASELRERAWAILEPLLALTSSEKKYCDRLQKGEHLPELLFPSDPDLAEQARSHPALLWKAQNARAHFRKGSRRKQ